LISGHLWMNLSISEIRPTVETVHKILALGNAFRAFGIFLVALFLMWGTTALPVSARTPSNGPVVALGDSFISGVGAGMYTDVGGCRQSARSYPQLFALRMGRTLVDLSCPGVTIADVYHRLDNIPRNSAIVLLQIGGNDIGFVRLAGTCFIAGRATCHESIAQARRTLQMMPENLLRLLRSIRARAPLADIVVMGYPQMLGSPTQCVDLMPPDRVWALRALQRQLDRTLRQSAIHARTHFLDWPIIVDRHSLCSEMPWYALPGDRIDDVFHPDHRATVAVADRLWRWIR